MRYVGGIFQSNVISSIGRKILDCDTYFKKYLILQISTAHNNFPIS